MCRPNALSVLQPTYLHQRLMQRWHELTAARLLQLLPVACCEQPPPQLLHAAAQAAAQHLDCPALHSAAVRMVEGQRDDCRQQPRVRDGLVYHAVVVQQQHVQDAARPHPVAAHGRLRGCAAALVHLGRRLQLQDLLQLRQVLHHCPEVWLEVIKLGIVLQQQAPSKTAQHSVRVKQFTQCYRYIEPCLHHIG